MLIKFLRQATTEFATRFGWLFLLAGLIPPGMEAFDTLTATKATATVTEVRTVCQMQTNAHSRKHWTTFPCQQRAEVEAAGTPVHTKDWAKLAFTGADGVERSAWANFGKLEIKEATVGQQLQILHRGDKKPYVARPFDWKLASLGLSFSLAGLVLLWIARRAAPAEETSGEPPNRSAKRHDDRLRSERQPAPTRVTTTNTKPVRAGLPVPQRVGVVQRERGWFG